MYVSLERMCKRAKSEDSRRLHVKVIVAVTRSKRVRLRATFEK